MQKQTDLCSERQRRDLSHMDPQTRQDLAIRARRQIVKAYGPPAADLFHHAERLVLDGRVQLTGRNFGVVYVEPAGWKNVYPGYCSHCLITDPTLVCVHKLAVAYADLLARHLALNTPVIASDRRERSNPQSTLIGHGGPPGRVHWHRHHSRRGDQQHCPRCGGWLTSDGSCHKCGGAR